MNTGHRADKKYTRYVKRTNREMMDLAAKMLNLNEDIKDNTKQTNETNPIFNLEEYGHEVDKLNQNNDMDDVNDDKSSKRSGKSARSNKK